MRPMDAAALVRPLFTEHDFTATRWNSAADKAWFANALCRFIAHDCPEKQWTKRLYRRLSLTFGHIAHYDAAGYWSVFFADLPGKVGFLEETLAWRCFGQPDYTWCDVERAVQRRVHAAGTFALYRTLLAAETEARERAQLALLRTKYDGVPATKPADLPVLRLSSSARPRSESPQEGQTRLL